MLKPIKKKHSNLRVYDDFQQIFNKFYVRIFGAENIPPVVKNKFNFFFFKNLIILKNENKIF